jgi:adenine C2-methylase RlmN of 23S rRNA A2503 and tRNA A37
MGEPFDNYDSVTAAANIMTQAQAPGLRLSANRYCIYRMHTSYLSSVNTTCRSAIQVSYVAPGFV